MKKLNALTMLSRSEKATALDARVNMLKLVLVIGRFLKGLSRCFLDNSTILNDAFNWICTPFLYHFVLNALFVFGLFSTD